MKWISAILILFTCSVFAQEITAEKYYFILEGDTIEGFYSDFEIENGKFEQYKVIECPKDRYLVGLVTAAHERELSWSQVLRGELKNFKPSGEWHQWLGSPDCECGGGFSWKSTTYLEGDSIQLNYWNYEVVMTSDSSYIKGETFDGYYFSKKWECIDNSCKIWLKSGSDTLECSYIEILMHLDAGWQSPMRFQRTEN
ncbi:MAG: hypothetical protein ACJAQ4_000423 [Cryomorphaceae bacterium]|jgi:hypothetical protein